jgi:hypothetical protein
MKPIQIISQDIFDKVRSRFSNLEMGDETGAVTIDPAEAKFFDFDFVHEGVKLGRVSISVNDPGSLKLYYSQGITEDQDKAIKKYWYNFLREMRLFAMRRLLRFDTRDIAKNNLDRNDFQYLANKQAPKDEESMTTMNESRWNQKSSRKTSRAVRGATEVIVRHHKPVDEMYPGSRSQRKNIKAIFIQNRDGERFKYPFIHPAGAFAMAQHVDHGGVPHDPAGKAIMRMSEQIAQLQEFQRKIQHSQLHDDAVGITDRAVSRLQELKNQVELLSKRHHYESWINEFDQSNSLDNELSELDAVTLEDYKSKFTETNFKEELAAYFPLIHSIMREANSINLEDYVSEGDDEHCDSCDKPVDKCVCNDVKEGAFAAFEQWAESVEQGKLTDDQIEALKTAIETELPDGKLELGDDGQTSWEFFSGAVALDDSSPEFSNDLKSTLANAAEIDPETNGLDVFQTWASQHYPELAVALGMSNEEEPESAPEPEAPTDQSPAEVPQPAAENTDMIPPNTMMPKESVKSQLVKEVAKIVKSFYNKDNPTVGPFRGEEGIALDVEKQISEKFGDQAGQSARQLAQSFMEKLTSEWESRHGKSAGVADDGLARLKELVGNIKQKVEGIGDQGEGGKDFNKNIMPAEDVSESLDDLAVIRKLSGLKR